MSHQPIIVNLQELRMSLASEDFFGPCDDEFTIKLPAALKEAMRREAARKRMSAAAFMRMALAQAIWGPEHVATLLAQRYLGDPKQVPTTVRTSDEAA